MAAVNPHPVGSTKDDYDFDEEHDLVYDHGHNRGILGRRKPAYYAESSKIVAYIKVIALSFVAIAPYYAVLDQLSATDVQSFIPCNEHGCHYMRFFASKNIPSTSSIFIRVQNGVSRPMAMKYDTFEPYTCAASNETRTFKDKALHWNQGCPPELTTFYDPNWNKTKDRRLQHSGGEDDLSLEDDLSHEDDLSQDDLSDTEKDKDEDTSPKKSEEDTKKPKFDCDAGYKLWQHGWSDAKKDWCCKHHKKGCHEDEGKSGVSDHDLTMEALARETSRSEEFSFALRWTFYLTKIPFQLITLPFRLVAQSKDSWGMEHIPNGRCPGMSMEKMQETCAAPSTKNGIKNHLKPWGPAKSLTVIGLVGWAILAAIHDVLLLRLPRPSPAHDGDTVEASKESRGHMDPVRKLGANEKHKPPYELKTLTVGALSTAFMGLAVAGVFMWAMGASEVFVAFVPGFGPQQCVCYYEIPHVTALVALATPFALLAAFAFKVQMNGMAALFGDNVYSMRFDIPHYLAHQSYLWTWNILISPKLAGTYIGAPRETFFAKDWVQLWRLQQFLFFWRYVMLIFFWLSAASFMVSSKELLLKLLLETAPEKQQTAFVQFCLKYIALPLPSVLALLLGLFGTQAAYNFFVPEKGDFALQVETAWPDPLDSIRPDKPALEKLKVPLFGVIAFALFIWTIAVIKGLSPDMNFLLGKEEAHSPALSQCELWGATGFIFFGLHVQAGLTYVASTWDDMVALKRLAKSDKHHPTKQTRTHHWWAQDSVDQDPGALRQEGGSGDENRTLLREAGAQA